jgi:hypothetical protein
MFLLIAENTGHVNFKPPKDTDEPSIFPVYEAGAQGFQL